jgi:peptide/nickel transport system permease protein
MSNSSAAPTEANLFQVLMHRKSVVVALAVMAVFFFAAVFADFITPVSPNKMAVSDRMTAPGGQYWFGSDEFGRDIFSRVVYSGRVSLTVGMGTALLASVFGIALGLVGGFFRRLDGVISRLIDAMMAFPDILLAISLLAALGSTMTNVIVALSIVYTPRIARIVRAATLVIRELAYVEAARALGVSTWRIMINHALRNMVSPVIVQATFIFAFSMLAESGLSFLGVGIDPSTPTWGTMINSGRQFIGIADWMIVFPGIAITICVLSLQIIGDGLRDMLDPRISREL